MIKGILPAIAMAMAVATVRQACFFWYHQPKVPESLISKAD